MEENAASQPVPSRADFDAAIERLDLPTVRSVWDAVSALSTLRTADEASERLAEWVYELQAMRFTTRRERGANDPLYFGPLSSWKGEDGVTYNDPDVKTLPHAALAYWEHRATEADNPILAARYADLVWTLKREVTGERPSPDFARIAARAYMRAAQDGWFEHRLYAIQGAERALELAVAINDPDLRSAASEALWRTESTDSPDNKPGLWGYSFRKLVLDKATIPHAMRDEIIADMEARFARLANGDPWSRESAGKMLSEHYSRASRQDEARKIWKAVGETFERDAGEDEALRASSILQHVASIYKKHGLSSEYAEAMRKVSVLGRKARDQMQKISHEIQIPAAEMEKAIAAHFEDTVEQTVRSIAVNQTPNRDKARDQLDDLISRNPLTYFFNHMITDYDGRTVATLKPPAEDPEPHLARHMAQSLTFDNIILSPVLDRFFGEYGVDAPKFVALLNNSVAFTDMQTPALMAGVTAYISGLYATAAHILVPQIERSFRQLLEVAGGSILKNNRDGGYDLVTLDEILRDPVLAEIFGENVTFYFRTLLTNKVGWNLRNDLCHGIVPWDHVGQPAAARLIHVLMMLSLTVRVESPA